MSDSEKIPSNNIETTTRATSATSTSNSTLEIARVDKNEYSCGDGANELPQPQPSSMITSSRRHDRELLDKEDSDCRPLSPPERTTTSSVRQQPESSSSSKIKKKVDKLSYSRKIKATRTRRGKSATSSQKKVSNNAERKNEKTRITTKAASSSYADGASHDRNSIDGNDRGNIENSNGNSTAYGDNDDYSLSTAPAPPSLRVGAHYSLRPGAYRMYTGGVAQYVDATSDDDIDNFSFHNTVNTTALNSGLAEDESLPSPPLYRSTTSEGYSFSDHRDFDNHGMGNHNVQVNSASFRDRNMGSTDHGIGGVTSTSTIEEVSSFGKDDANKIIFFNKRNVVIMFCIFVIILLPTTSIGGIYANKAFGRGSKSDEEIHQSPSLTPTKSSLTLSEIALESFIEGLPDYTKKSLQIESSPQSKAINWMSTYDDIESYSLSRQLQRFALICLYFSIASRFPDHEVLTWLAGLNECVWYDSTCVDNIYTVLSLQSSHAWRGIIIPELALLSSLERLRIEPNALVGVLPSELGQVTTLREIRINGNLLRGTIPTEFGKLSNLEHIELGSNILSGSIPKEIGSWKKVQTFILANNTFAGTIPSEIGRMSNLIRFSASSNQLIGQLPSEIGQLKRIKRFNVQENYITGEFISKFENLGHTLQYLQLRSNEFSGTLTSSIGFLLNLVELDISNNGLMGALPTEVGLMTSLTSLQLHSNSFHNMIPTELGLLPSIESMHMYDNLFTGTVPLEICELTSTYVLLPEELIVDCDALLCWCCSCTWKFRS